MTQSEHVEALRFVAWALESFCVVLAAHHVADLVTNARSALTVRQKIKVTLGIAIKCAGWALHQLYWWVWQVAHVKGIMQVKTTMEEWAGVTLFAYILIYVGSGLVISPYAERVAGSRWKVVTAGFLATLWCLGAALTHI